MSRAASTPIPEPGLARASASARDAHAAATSQPSPALEAARGDRRGVRLARALLFASAAVHLYFGTGFALSPEPWMESLSIAATSPVGRIEMRAFYGGLMLALGALFLAAATLREALLPGTVMMTVTYLGAAIVRTAGIVAAGVADSMLSQILAIEAGGAVLGGVAWWQLARAEREARRRAP